MGSDALMLWVGTLLEDGRPETMSNKLLLGRCRRAAGFDIGTPAGLFNASLLALAALSTLTTSEMYAFTFVLSSDKAVLIGFSSSAASSKEALSEHS